MKHNGQEITVEKIKERIKEHLRNVQYHANYIHSTDDFELSLKKKIIAFGLNNKYLIKKVPLLNAIARKLYHMLLYKIYSEKSSPLRYDKINS